MYPDSWRIVRVTNQATGNIHYRVLVSYPGSYTSGRSWMLNSGIKSVEEFLDYIVFFGKSGSEYRCPKTCETLNYYLEGIFKSYYEEGLPEGILLELVNYEDVKGRWDC